MQLPLRLNLQQLQNQWSSILNPLLAKQLVQGQLLQNIVLKAGNNVVNHGLGRPLIGWFPVRLNAATSLYDAQDTNQTPNLTLLLNSSAACTCSLWVF